MTRSTRNVVKHMASRLREIREKAGMSKSQLAVIIGTSYQTVIDIELGKRATSFDVALRLADALNVPVDSLRQPPGSPVRNRNRVHEWKIPREVEYEGETYRPDGRVGLFYPDGVTPKPCVSMTCVSKTANLGTRIWVDQDNAFVTTE